MDGRLVRAGTEEHTRLAIALGRRVLDEYGVGLQTLGDSKAPPTRARAHTWTRARTDAQTDSTDRHSLTHEGTHMNIRGCARVFRACARARARPCATLGVNLCRTRARARARGISTMRLGIRRPRAGSGPGPAGLSGLVGGPLRWATEAGH